MRRIDYTPNLGEKNTSSSLIEMENLKNMSFPSKIWGFAMKTW